MMTALYSLSGMSMLETSARFDWFVGPRLEQRPAETEPVGRVPEQDIFLDKIPADAVAAVYDPAPQQRVQYADAQQDAVFKRAPAGLSREAGMQLFETPQEIMFHGLLNLHDKSQL